MKTYLLPLIGIIFCLTSCKKDKDKKPVARQDVFECKVNGQHWQPEVPNEWITNKLESSYQSGVFSLLARKKGAYPIHLMKQFIIRVISSLQVNLNFMEVKILILSILIIGK